LFVCDIAHLHKARWARKEAKMAEIKTADSEG
jgi:hypothetical protein